MVKKFAYLLVAVIAISAATLFAQEGNVGEGTVTLEKKTYQLKNAVAYEATILDDDLISVVLSGQKIASDKVREAKEKDKAGETAEFRRPFLKLEFKKTGELQNWSAGVGETTLGRRSGHATGKLKLQEGRVTGKASQPTETEGMFPSGFDVHFDLALIKSGDALPAAGSKKPGPAANVTPSVTGVFKGNGKEAKLSYVSAHWREPFDDKPSIVLVFTEKDHSNDKKPDFNASFGKFGSALVVSLHEDGSIFGCEVSHSANKKRGFSSIGSIKTNDFTFEDGKVTGELATEGPVDFFGETWEVNIKFVAPLGEIPKEFEPAESKKPEKEDEPVTMESDEKPATNQAADQLKAKDLALTKDATDVEYKGVVGHVVFKSKSDTKRVCAELSASLKAQGWKKDGDDLITPASSILKRKRGEATLTIFVKPENGSTEVKMLTEGLSWDEQ